MTYAIIDIDTTLDESGGANDEVIETYSGGSVPSVFQWVVSGSSADVDIHLEARLSDRLDWEDYIAPSIGQSDTGDLHSLDLPTVDELRIRIVNQDGTAGNTADVDAILTTDR
jgi:hypothetical protein